MVLKKLITKATKEVEFSFDNKMYKQVDGIAMGSPLGPTLANIFVGFYEEKLFNDVMTKPLLYYRYVDDCFAIFNIQAEAINFLNLLNRLHPSLRFTMESEVHSRLSFLDVLVIREGNDFLTTIYRKPTFTGLYVQWESFSPKRQKVALNQSLTTRAKRICSTSLLRDELDFLRNIFIYNGYPHNIIDRQMELTLRDRFAFIGPKRCPIYLKLPWLGDISTRFESHISNLVSNAFPALRLFCCFSSRFAFSTTNKDVLPVHNLSNIIYSFTCDCERRYTGKTTQRLMERVKQHIPASLTNAALTLRSLQPGDGVTSLPPPQQQLLAQSLLDSRSDSAITRHLKSHHNCLRAVCGPNMLDHFSILSRARNQFHLDVLEAVYIKVHNPELCQQKEYVKVLYLV